MIRVSYIATRNLVGRHNSGDSVILSFSASDLTPSREVSVSSQRAVGGQRETLHHFGLRTWSVTTGPLSLHQLDQLQEFLGSVEGGETFTFEPWRWETGPSLDLDFITPRLRVAEAITCKLTSAGYSLSRINAAGTGGADDDYTIGFTVAEEP